VKEERVLREVKRADDREQASAAPPAPTVPVKAEEKETASVERSLLELTTGPPPPTPPARNALRAARTLVETGYIDPIQQGEDEEVISFAQLAAGAVAAQLTDAFGGPRRIVGEYDDDRQSEDDGDTGRARSVSPLTLEREAARTNTVAAGVEALVGAGAATARAAGASALASVARGVSWFRRQQLPRPSSSAPAPPQPKRERSQSPARLRTSSTRRIVVSDSDEEEEEEEEDKPVVVKAEPKTTKAKAKAKAAPKRTRQVQPQPQQLPPPPPQQQQPQQQLQLHPVVREFRLRNSDPVPPAPFRTPAQRREALKRVQQRRPAVRQREASAQRTQRRDSTLQRQQQGRVEAFRQQRVRSEQERRRQQGLRSIEVDRQRQLREIDARIATMPGRLARARAAQRAATLRLEQAQARLSRLYPARLQRANIYVDPPPTRRRRREPEQQPQEQRTAKPTKRQRRRLAMGGTRRQ
jgi:hypothetical protein